MKKALKLTAATLLALTAGLALGILSGCSTSLPPITGTYINDDGDTVTVNTSTNGLNITYVEACQTCGAPIPLTASTPLVPAECDNCSDIRARHQQRSTLLPSRLQPLSGRKNLAQQERLRSESLYPVSAAAAGLTAVDPRAYNGWPGNCPGCDIDAWIMQCLITSFDYPCSAIYNKQVTLSGVIASADQALNRLAPNGLLFLTISGHGSHTRDLNGDEPSGQDQQLCLWDGKLLDDQVWILLNRIRTRRPDVRILMISDTCHSGSNYRSSRPMAFAPGISKRASSGSAEPNLLHFAGCSDSSYSYGSSQGGVFTTALIDAFDPYLTYAQWFNTAAALMPASQKPVMEFTGTYFGDHLIFK